LSGILEEALLALRAAGKSATAAGKERFSKLLQEASPHALESPGLMREFPAGQLAVPDNVFDITQTSSKFSQYPEQMKNTVLGQYDNLRNEITYNRFSDLFDRKGYDSEAIGNSAHEFTHSLQNQPDKLVGTPYESTVKDNAEILGINKFLRGAQDKDVRQDIFMAKNKVLDEDELAAAIYGINPLETSASRMGMLSRGVAGDPSLVKGFRDRFLPSYTTFNKDSLERFKSQFPRAADLAKKYTKDYLPAIGAVGLGAGALAFPEKGEASTTEQQVMSNIDKTVPANGGIPVINPLGSFSEGLGGVGEIGKGVGKWGQEYARGTGKVLRTLTGERKGRGEGAELPTGEDWEKAVNTASLFFNPAGKAGMTALTTGFDWLNPSEAGADSTLEGKSKEELGISRTTPYEQRTVSEVVQNVALGVGAAGLAALAAKSPLLKGEAGAISMKGFFSPLTKALTEGKIGKSLLSPKMSGEQVLKTLQSAGIKEDELVFSGVGEALASIGKDKIGPSKMAEIAKIAEEGALGFTRHEHPGIYAEPYSLFSKDDPSFKTITYKYPGVGFTEEHIANTLGDRAGEGVVAHRRVGDKEVRPNKDTMAMDFDFARFGGKAEEEIRPEVIKAAREYERLGNIMDRTPVGDVEYYNLQKQRSKIYDKFTADADDTTPLNSLLLDEVQSQFYEKGSKFGHGEMKGLPEGVVPTDPSGNYKRFDDAYKGAIGKPGYTVPENMKDDMTRYVELGDVAEKVDRNTPQGFAKGLSVDDEAGKIYSRYVPETDLSVENAPLRGEKYVELLAKDHMRDALASGKDAISWTPSEVQHERYYGKGALGDVRWEFMTNDPRKKALESLNKLSGTTGKEFTDWHDAYKWAKKYINKHGNNLENLSNEEYNAYRGAVEIRDLDAMSSEYKVESGLSFKLPNGMAKVAQSFEDLQKNVGSAAAKNILERLSAGETSGTVEGNAKEVYQKLYDRAIPKAFEKLTGEKPRKGFVKGKNGEDVEIYWIPLDKAKEKFVSGTEKAVPVFDDVADRIKSFDAYSHSDLDEVKKQLNFIVNTAGENSKAGKIAAEDLKMMDRFNNPAKIKDLPIASHEQTARDFFSV